MSALRAFVRESNEIEGIHRPGTEAEVEAHRVFLALDVVSVDDLERFVATVASANLRRRAGMDVRVGNHRPAPGGPAIERELMVILEWMQGGPGPDGVVATPFEVHAEYEMLHPFMDGNGRSGRALWAWHMQSLGMDPFALPFLRRFYYQALDGWRPA